MFEFLEINLPGAIQFVNQDLRMVTRPRRDVQIRLLGPICIQGIWISFFELYDRLLHQYRQHVFNVSRDMWIHIDAFQMPRISHGRRLKQSGAKGSMICGGRPCFHWLSRSMINTSADCIQAYMSGPFQDAAKEIRHRSAHTNPHRLR